jgi:hypothetical protein
VEIQKTNNPDASREHAEDFARQQDMGPSSPF